MIIDGALPASGSQWASRCGGLPSETATLTDNVICGNGENLNLTADPSIDDSNEICGDAPEE